MGLEIERRFLVVADGWRGLAGPPQVLKQGYIAASAEGVTVRMRLRNDGQAWLTLKAAAEPTGIARHEFEYAIPSTDAGRCGKHRIGFEKTRYALDLAGGDRIVDCFAEELGPGGGGTDAGG